MFDVRELNTAIEGAAPDAEVVVACANVVFATGFDECMSRWACDVPLAPGRLHVHLQ